MDADDVKSTFDSIKSMHSFDFDLKDKQVHVLTSTLNSRNVFAVLPTGYGKSMCFILPPLLWDEVCLI